jgi:hypothetical protein
MTEHDAPMNDHETFLLLAARSLTEPLPREEEARLEAHMATCPDCRSILAGMRRDDVRLHAALKPVPVAPRVRERVLAEAAGGRRLAVGRVALLLAAALALGVIGVPLIAGGSRGPAASGLPSPSTASLRSPTVSLTPSNEPSPPTPSAAALPTGPGPLVNANYTYLDRTDSVAARLKDGKPVGEWWRQTEVGGKTESYGGPVTCLVIEGPDAWVAGPATTASDGRKDLAILFRLHDGGANGDDSARGYLTNPGQTLTTMQTWCETRYTPADLAPLTSGDVSIEAAP